MMAASAEVIIHKNARADMLAQKMPGLPRITYTDETQIFLGGKEVLARHVRRGHTNGDAVIYFPSERVLHTGDLFVHGGAPFIDYSSGGTIQKPTPCLVTKLSGLLLLDRTAATWAITWSPRA